MIAHGGKVDHSEISAAEVPAFLKGVAEGFKGAPCPYYYAKIIPDVRILAKARREKYVSALIDKNQAEAKAFFAELDMDPNVVKLPDGLRYKIIRPGTGPCPIPKQTVKVHFLGHLLDGTEFTQSGPVDLVLWPNRFNSYLYEGLQKINKGGYIRLYVSSLPTETEVAMYNIEPGSMMIYEVELLDVKDTPPDVLAITVVPDAPEAPTPPPSGYSEQQIIETWGWSAVRRTSVPLLGFDAAELSPLTKGLMEGINGQPPPYDMEKIYPVVQQFVGDRREKAREAFKEKQLAAMSAFFAELKKNPNVIETPSGLCYEIVKPGSGRFAKPGDTLKIHYTGRLLSGKVFDRTDVGDTYNVKLRIPPGPWPMPGWYEGLQKINQGGEIELYIPPALAFGDEAYSGAPPYSTLIFDIEVAEIEKTPAAGNK